MTSLREVWLRAMGTEVWAGRPGLWSVELTDYECTKRTFGMADKDVRETPASGGSGAGERLAVEWRLPPGRPACVTCCDLGWVVVTDSTGQQLGERCPAPGCKGALLEDIKGLCAYCGAPPATKHAAHCRYNGWGGGGAAAPAATGSGGTGAGNATTGHQTAKGGPASEPAAAAGYASVQVSLIDVSQANSGDIEHRANIAIDRLKANPKVWLTHGEPSEDKLELIQKEIVYAMRDAVAGDRARSKTVYARALLSDVYSRKAEAMHRRAQAAEGQLSHARKAIGHMEREATRLKNREKRQRQRANRLHKKAMAAEAAVELLVEGIASHAREQVAKVTGYGAPATPAEPPMPFDVKDVFPEDWDGSRWIRGPAPFDLTPARYPVLLGRTVEVAGVLYEVTNVDARAARKTGDTIWLRVRPAVAKAQPGDAA